MPKHNPKYTPKMLQKSKDYIGIYDELGQMIPSASGLSVYLGVCRRTLYYWSESRPEFKQVMEEIQSKQEMLLLNGGLRGDMNSTICKLALAKHGYSDNVKTELSGPDGGAIKTESKWTVEPVKPVDEAPKG